MTVANAQGDFATCLTKENPYPYRDENTKVLIKLLLSGRCSYQDDSTIVWGISVDMHSLESYAY